MNRVACLILSATVLVGPSVTQAASSSDKETKELVLDLHAGMKQLLEEIRTQQREAGARQIEERELLQKKQDADQETIKRQETLLQAILQRLEKISQVTAEIAAQPPVAAAAPPAAEMTVDKETERRISRLESILPIALVLVGAGILLLIGLIVTVRRSEERIKKEIAGVDREPSNPEPVGRPQIQVRTEDSRLALVNVGQSPADEIRLYVGPAPSTLRQRQKAIGQIPAGQKTEVDLSHQLSADVLYGSLEYKHLRTGKLYKDHFVLKVDRASGEIITDSLTA